MSTEQKSQKQAVIDAVTTVLGARFMPSATNVKSTLSSDELTNVRDIVFNGVVAGLVTYNKDLSDTTGVKKYVNGMIDNHLRKAKELNGGVAYQAASTSKRTKKAPVVEETAASLLGKSNLSEDLADIVSDL